MKIASYLLVLSLTLFVPRLVPAQPFFPSSTPIFNDAIIPRVDIYVDPADLATIYANIWSNIEYPATFIFNDGISVDTVFNVGFRLRGNTSRSSAKKSFKVAFNSFVPGKMYKGLEKMNLNGEHNDPSIVRSKLCWDLLRKMKIPAPRSNHVDLYINGDFYGLYINVEHIDEEFANSRFGNKNGNLFKCTWPADLNYISNNPNDYKGLGYELKTNTLADDFSDLANFIDVLNNTSLQDFPCALREIFNVEDYLKVIAFDVLTANWDGPLYNKNNFYLYHNTATDKFEYIPYDLDNTFGIDWFGIDWAVRDMYSWGHPNEYRPLYERILDVPEFKDQYSYYMDQITNSFFDPTNYFAEIEAMKNLISPSVQMDTYAPLDYGFLHSDFLNSFDQALWGHVTFGIKPFITARRGASISQVVQNNISPIVKYLKSNQPQINEDIIFNATMEDDDSGAEIWVIYQVNGGTKDSIQMIDDGFNEDGFPNDGIYGAILPGLSQPGNLTFYLRSSDPMSHSVRTPCVGQRSIVIDTTSAQIYINEFMAVNHSTIIDEFGESEDWIEIYNADTGQIWMGDIYLTDNLNNTDKWNLPDTNMGPGEFLLIWADEDSSQGPYHANFRLNQFGESIGLFQDIAGSFIPLDIITFGPQDPDVTYGYYPDGTGNHQLMGSPTPGFSNVSVGIEEFENSIFKESVTVSPNPFDENLVLAFSLEVSQNLDIRLLDINGRNIEQIASGNYSPGKHIITWSGKEAHLESGLYLIQIFATEPTSGKSNLYSKRVIKVRR